MSMQQPRSRAGSRRARVTALLVPVVASLLVAGCSDSGGGASAPASVLASASASPSAAAPSPTPSPTPPVVTGPWESKPDLAYAIASQTQKLDLFLPERTGSAVPLVILIHGGGWQLGDKREVEGFVKPLTEQGYAVASINYRLSGEARFPAGVLDAKAAVRWLRAHAGEYGMDPGPVRGLGSLGRWQPGGADRGDRRPGRQGLARLPRLQPGQCQHVVGSAGRGRLLRPE